MHLRTPLVALLVALFVGPVTAPAVADGNGQERRAALAVTPHTARRPVAPQAARGTAGPPSGRFEAQASTDWRDQAYAESEFWDVCHDPAGPVDLRTVDIADESNAELTLFSATLCEPVTVPQLDGVSIEWSLHPIDGPSDGPDRVVALYTDAATGDLAIAVVDTPSDDPDTWRTVYEGAAQLDDHGHELWGVVPWRALDYEIDFHFGVTAFDAADDTDHLPEIGRPLLGYPNPCNGFIELGATVSTDDAPGTAARLRRAGFHVSRSTRGAVALAGVTDAELTRLREVPGVESVRRPVLFGRALTPDDEAFSLQWALSAIDAPRAWDIHVNSGLELAVIDDGVDGTRLDLLGRVAAGYDTVAGHSLPAGHDSDLGLHGTAVSGVAAAAGGNGEDVAGVDWGAVIVPFRVVDAASCISDVAVADAINRAADRGVEVINLSLGGIEPSEPVERAVAYAQSKDAVVVAAVGNEGLRDGTLTYPAAYPGVVGVGATTTRGELAAYSNRGPHVDIVAPGGDGSATVSGDIVVLWQRGTLEPVSGTSFSAPMVAGAALLYRSLVPTAGPREVAAALFASAVDLGEAGRDQSYGWGQLNLNALLLSTGAEPERPTVVIRSIDDACPAGEVPEDGLTDVERNVHEGSVDCVIWWEVVTRWSPGRFAPTHPVTRGVMADWIARYVERAGGFLEPADGTDRFSDIASSPYRSAINRIAAARVIGGYPDGTFRPQAPVTRAQMATFLISAYQFTTGQQLPPPAGDYFADDEGSVHEGSIDRLASVGIAGGTGPSTYSPTADVQRDQMASFLARLLDAAVEAGTAAPPV